MNRRLLLMSGVALLLGIYAVADGQLSGWLPVPGDGTPGNGAPKAATPAAAATPAKLNPLEGLEAQSLSAMLERPVFNPSRAPRPPEPPPPPPPPEPVEQPPPENSPPAGPNAQDFKLIAVLGGNSGGVAVIRIFATGEVLYLRAGQPVANWTLLSVDAKSVSIGSPESNVTLKLFEPDGTAPPPPEPAPAEQPPPPPQEDGSAVPQ